MSWLIVVSVHLTNLMLDFVSKQLGNVVVGFYCVNLAHYRITHVSRTCAFNCFKPQQASHEEVALFVRIFPLITMLFL